MQVQSHFVWEPFGVQAMVPNADPVKLIRNSWNAFVLFVSNNKNR
ncbi:MAG TPA: hypothetical protein VMC43_03395 [Candidatus Paceibacterota bacterium]|nr:hypothetical protein [Candidatus Paceibacterota bacterium]